MDSLQEKLISKFISGKRLTEDEFLLLDRFFDEKEKTDEVYKWMEDQWENCHSEEVALRFEDIRKRIRNESRSNKRRIVISIYRKVAAILIVPLLIFSLYLMDSRLNAPQLFSLSTQKGEQTNVILPDGSKVWLNVDSKLSYPINYGDKTRELQLIGEAYFEVVKNDKLPFIVAAGGITTTALGTSFMVSSYPESSVTTSSLLKGSIEVKSKELSKVLNPGQQLIYNKNKQDFTVQTFRKEEGLAWKDNQLAFRLTPFVQVIEKLEKWYDVEFKYDSKLFEDETLTVKFSKYETLEQVLEIIAIAGNLEYEIYEKRVTLSPKK